MSLKSVLWHCEMYVALIISKGWLILRNWFIRAQWHTLAESGGFDKNKFVSARLDLDLRPHEHGATTLTYKAHSLKRAFKSLWNYKIVELFACKVNIKTITSPKGLGICQEDTQDQPNTLRTFLILLNLINFDEISFIKGDNWYLYKNAAISCVWFDQENCCH